jgi:hypothetical protein
VTRRSRRGGPVSALTERIRDLPAGVAALAFIAACVAVVAIPIGIYEIGRSVLGGDDSASGPAKQTLKKAMWGETEFPNGKSLFPTYADLGVGIYQSQVHWDQIAAKKPKDPTDPQDPAYIWPGGLEQTIKTAERNGITTMLMPIGTPPWANGGRPMIWTPTKPSDFADFTTALAKRYPSVHLWMIWGEPNRAPNYQPLTPAVDRVGPLNKAQQVAPRNYAELVDAAYGALKEASPENKVIGGNTFTSAGPDAIYPYQWLKYMTLPDGSRPRMDMWGHNPYGFREPSLDHPSNRPSTVSWGDLEHLTEELDKAFPGPPLKLYLSEWGVPIGFKDKDLLYEEDEETGEEWIHAAYEIARDWDRIYTLGWVHPLDTDRSSQGLMDPEGNKKPSYEFYKDS